MFSTPIKVITLITLLLSFLSIDSFASDCSHTNDSFRCVKYLSNYDGDTIRFDIPSIHPLLGKKIAIRVNGVDTPEKRTKNLCEKQKARSAQKLVASIMKDSKRIDLKNIKRGKYFRIVADVIVDGRDLGAMLIKNKLAYPYFGKTKKKINWCKP